MTSTKRIPRKRQSLRKGPVCSICKHEHRVLIESTRNHRGSAHRRKLARDIVLARSPGFGKLIAEETDKVAKVVKFSGAKPD